MLHLTNLQKTTDADGETSFREILGYVRPPKVFSPRGSVASGDLLQAVSLPRWFLVSQVPPKPKQSELLFKGKGKKRIALDFSFWEWGQR